jgi:hypothetical protein
MTGEADEALVAGEIERRRAAGTDQDIAMASLLADVPTDVAAAFIRDGMLRALGGPPQGEYWLRIQELNFLAHQKRRANAWRAGRVMGPGLSVMATIPDE